MRGRGKGWTLTAEERVCERGRRGNSGLTLVVTVHVKADSLGVGGAAGSMGSWSTPAQDLVQIRGSRHDSRSKALV